MIGGTVIIRHSMFLVCFVCFVCFANNSYQFQMRQMSNVKCQMHQWQYKMMRVLVLVLVVVLAEQNQDRFIYIYRCTHTQKHISSTSSPTSYSSGFFELAMSHSTRTWTPTDSACLSLHPSNSIGAP